MSNAKVRLLSRGRRGLYVSKLHPGLAEQFGLKKHGDGSDDYYVPVGRIVELLRALGHNV